MNDFRKCFAYAVTKCNCLEEMLCKKKGKCSFFKTRKQLLEQEALILANRLRKFGGELNEKD